MKNTRILLSTLLIALFSSCISPAIYADDGELNSVEQLVSEVNVNSASALELAEKLDGVGKARAQLIIEYREKHGPFTSVDQLLNVKGIGAATLEKNREKIRL
ncbi:ComEA family DNA-binding protein [Microbulbifer epialgicus]|uniref:ComEA family DNA-binding protein n=1 Tax=Microbulbifer epialgicus TaxID=393907 RepID=A0ABV4NXH1_9GAMM